MCTYSPKERVVFHGCPLEVLLTESAEVARNAEQLWKFGFRFVCQESEVELPGGGLSSFLQ